MMTSPHLNSDTQIDAQDSMAFSLLHEKVQRWIWTQKWTELRDIQEQSIAHILPGDRDVLIAAATAGGKTEAAFLPICSQLVSVSPESIQVLYLSPLKALINDQFERLSDLCLELDIPVHRWHGDVAQSYKRRVLQKPNGILLITPESLEALFIRQGHQAKTIFSRLCYIVIDELHSFLGTERGRQVQSLIHRLEIILQRQVPCIGLSATLGDMDLATNYLHPRTDYPCQLIISAEGGQELKLQLRGVCVLTPDPKKTKEHDGSRQDISNDLFKKLRGTSNLIFANRRADVEDYADQLRRLSEYRCVPNEFWAHHGSLSKELREDIEEKLKDTSRPLTAVCTSTLELGIDIGTVTSIAQIEVPPSVASMRQRLGRSGRRGEPAIMRIYIRELEITDTTPPQDCLRAELVQTIAMVQLLIKRWYEPPITGRLHFSTLIQQTLSVIAQYGGATAQQLWRGLCGQGPFMGIDQRLYAQFLKCLGRRDLLQQMSDGTLVLGMVGERLVNHYSFYTAFQTPEEYQLMSEGTLLGTLPISFPLFEGAYIIFFGKRWKVIHVQENKKIVELVPAEGGRPPVFGGTAALVHDRVRQEMKAVYLSEDIPPFLDANARDMLGEGRDFFRRYNLANRTLFTHGNDTLIFPWCGDQILYTILVQLKALGLNATYEGIALNVANIDASTLHTTIQKLIDKKPPDPIDLARVVDNKIAEKYDHYLSDDLMDMEFATKNFDMQKTYCVLGDIASVKRRI